MPAVCGPSVLGQGLHPVSPPSAAPPSKPSSTAADTSLASALRRALSRSTQYWSTYSGYLRETSESLQPHLRAYTRIIRLSGHRLTFRVLGHPLLSDLVCMAFKQSHSVGAWSFVARPHARAQVDTSGCSRGTYSLRPQTSRTTSTATQRSRRSRSCARCGMRTTDGRHSTRASPPRWTSCWPSFWCVPRVSCLLVCTRTDTWPPVLQDLASLQAALDDSLAALRRSVGPDALTALTRDVADRLRDDVDVHVLPRFHAGVDVVLEELQEALASAADEVRPSGLPRAARACASLRPH